MSNVMAIAHKELKAYFASPIAYVVIGLFALMYGYFFVALLSYFVQQSQQVAGFGGAVNINEQLMGPLLLNAAVVLLFTLPMITMRAYSEEKRSGTIELLLTAPLTDVQIILGKFAGAMTLYAAMLGITLVHTAALFYYGEPEWLPVATGYLGLFLMGGCFIALGLFISSLTKNQIVAGFLTFAVFLMLWIINWVAQFAPPFLQSLLNYLAITEHLDDFTRGILDTRHLVYYLSFIGFGLFLTARSVDVERWRG